MDIFLCYNKNVLKYLPRRQELTPWMWQKAGRLCVNESVRCFNCLFQWRGKFDFGSAVEHYNT